MKKQKQRFLWITLALVWPVIACLAGSGTQPPAPPAEPTEAVQPQQPEENVSGPAPAADEAGHTLELAEEITPGVYTGVLAGEQPNWYKLEVPPGYILSLALTAGEDVADDPLAIRLWDSDQKEIAFKDIIQAGITKSFTKVMNNSTGGTYFVTVYGQGSYNLEITGQEQNDADSGRDAGDALHQATPVQLGSAISGHIGDYDEQDWYVVEIPPGHNLSLSFRAQGEFVDTPFVRLKDGGEQEKWLSDRPALEETITHEILLEAGGPYYLEVGQYNEGWGSYTLELK